MPLIDGREKPLGRLPGGFELRNRVAISESRENALLRPRGEKLIQDIFDAALRGEKAEVVCGHVFELWTSSKMTAS